MLGFEEPEYRGSMEHVDTLASNIRKGVECWNGSSKYIHENDTAI